MIFREATAEEKPYLAERLAATEHEQVALDHCWVAEQDGKVIGMLPARLVWQIEPLFLFPEVKNTMTRSRAALGMYIVAENWIRQQPIHWFFVVTRSAAVKRWAKKLGWYGIYSGAATYVKHL